jgi:segregation and condensation protein B
MSLKAKIEAVIYAADEPVTLAQLATLFGEEALREQRSQEGLSFATEEQSGDASADPATAELALGDGPAGQPEPAAGSEPEPVTDDEAEAKKRARAREREARAVVAEIVTELNAEYAAGDRGMEIREIAGGYRVATRPEYHDAVRMFVKNLKPRMKLSLQALETLAVVAYKQPVTAPEISEIRGVDTSGVLGGLMARKLIATAGRKQVIGRPILYKTTKEFLLRFGLKDVSELPSMEEFEALAADMAQDMEQELEAPGPQDSGVEETVANDSEPEKQPVEPVQEKP